jgi:isoleucyl-tRNA synthetase
VLHLVVERLAGLIAPVLCHMAEDIWQNLPYPVAEASVFERGWPTVPEAWRVAKNTEYTFEDHTGIKDLLLTLRPLVNRSLQELRLQKPVNSLAKSVFGDKGKEVVADIFGENFSKDPHSPTIGSSLEAQVQLVLDDIESTALLRQTIDRLKTSPHLEVDNLADWLLVSALQIGGEAPAAVLAEASDEGITVRIARAEGEKCERCWHYETEIGQHAAHPTVCGRCVAVLEG